MGFNAERFGQDTLAPRTRVVPVPELATWFDTGDAAVFTVRGLSADELAKAKDAHAMHLRKSGLLQALEQSNPDPELIAEEFKKAIAGSAEDKHSQIAMRQEMLRLALVEPKLDESAIAKLAQHYALALYRLSDAINDLTGLGSEALKKPKRSSATAPSEPVSD